MTPELAGKIYGEYTSGRAALIESCRAAFPEALASAKKEKALEHIFWEKYVCAPDSHPPLKIYGGDGGRRLNVLELSLADGGMAPEIEKCGEWKRLPVTVSRVLPLSDHADGEKWFDALSKKNRKKLRWLRNAVPEHGCSVVPLTDELFDMFAGLYLAQFDCDVEVLEKGVRSLYAHLAGEGRMFARLLLAPDGKTPLAAGMGYFLNDSFFFTHLTRGGGNPEYDKYSPGFYLTYAMIRELFDTRPRMKFFFMGPGDYDYKHAYLGEAMKVYRYERDSLCNIFGLLRLRHRLAKERRIFSAQGAEGVRA